VPGLKSAARKFVQSSFALLEPIVVEKNAERFGPARWERSGGEMFVLREPMRSREEWCLIDERPRLSQLPESVALDGALRQDSRIGPLIGNLVGTPLASALVDEEGLKGSLLWAVLRADDSSFHFSKDAFDRGYAAWVKDSTAKAQENVALAPLTLEFDGDLDLGDGITITQLSDAEVSDCLYAGAIRRVFPTQSDTAWVRNRTAIRIKYELSRGLLDNFSDEDSAVALATETAAVESAQEVIDALRIFKRGRVSVTGRVALRGGLGGTVFFGGGSAVPQVAEADLVLSPPEADSFAGFWSLFRAARGTRALAASIRRFSYAGERSRPDDEIVDLVAALEGLLLSEIADRGELTFRTALRGALFIDASGLTRREVKRQLIRGYSVRSAVAHGGEPNTKDLKAANGDAVTLEEFVDGIEDLVRLAVRKAVEAVGARTPWPPDWDALTLEGETYPD
jgi:hypothetical protein